jgi:hypothetical protein
MEKNMKYSKAKNFTKIVTLLAFAANFALAQEFEPQEEPAMAVQEEAVAEPQAMQEPQVELVVEPPPAPAQVASPPPPSLPPPAIGQLSGSCVNEFLNLPQTKANFSIQGFFKELPVVVTEVKTKEKAGKFGRLPPDDQLTNLGVSVGCVKQFPANPGQIKSLLIDQLAPEMARSIVANELGVQRSEISLTSEPVLNLLKAAVSGGSSPASQNGNQSSGGMKIGIIGGVNLSTFNESWKEGSYSLSLEFDKKFGLQGGIAFDMPLSNVFYFQPGLMFIQKGIKGEGGSGSSSNCSNDGCEYYEHETDFTVTANYIKMPLLFSIKGSVTEGVAIRINAGPYLAYGIGDGSMEREGKEYRNGSLVESYKNSEKFFGKHCEYDYEYSYCREWSRLDYGLSFGGGVQFGSVYFGVFYDYGLANIFSAERNYDLSDYKISTRSMGVNVGYFF